jgi:phage I-like protein
LTALGPLQPLQARASVATAACTALQLPADASAEVITAACTSLRTGQADPARFVPVETVTQLQSQIAALTARQMAADVDALVKPALADGRLLPAMEDWARNLGKTNVAALTSYLAAAQPIAALTGTQTQGLPPSGTAKGDAQLSAAELAVCTAMGLTPEQYKAGAAAIATSAAA